MTRRGFGGTVFVEAALVFIPFFALTLGSIEFMWHFHIRQSLTAAADAAVREAATYHGESGSPASSLNYLRPAARTAAKDMLQDIGFSEAFIEDVTVNLDYVQKLTNVKQGLNIQGGFPQKEKMRLIGAVVSVPWLRAMIFGNFVLNTFNIAHSQPSELVVIVFSWKKWKVN